MLDLNQKISWEKLKLELEHLSFESPHSLVPLAISLQCVLTPGQDTERAYRALNFMTYELLTLAQGLSEFEKFEMLNEYFFDKKKFRFIELMEKPSQQILMMDEVLHNKTGDLLCLSMIYQHLANQLDLPIYLINLQGAHILKFVHCQRSFYIHLENQGQLIGPSDFAILLTREKTLGVSNDESSLDILPSRKLFKRYLHNLFDLFSAEERDQESLILLDALILLDPESIDQFAKRALVRQRLGHCKEALADFNRYFAFVNRSQAPQQIQTAFRQIQALTEWNFDVSDLESIH